MISGILVNTFDITTIPYVSILWRNIHNLPVRNLNAYKLARQDGEKLVSAEYTHRVISLPGEIHAPDRATLESTLDSLLAVLQTPNSTIDIPKAGSTRRFYGTLSNYILSDDVGGGLAAFDIEIICSDPLGYSTTATTLTFAGITTASNTQSFTFGGTYAALPVLTYTFTALTGGAGAAVSVKNAAGTGVIITRTWTAGDVLVVDCNQKTVKVNGVAVDYTGAFPSFPVVPAGATGVVYSDTLTTRTVTVTGNYAQRWI